MRDGFCAGSGTFLDQFFYVLLRVGNTLFTGMGILDHALKERQTDKTRQAVTENTHLHQRGATEKQATVLCRNRTSRAKKKLQG